MIVFLLEGKYDKNEELRQKALDEGYLFSISTGGTLLSEAKSHARSMANLLIRDYEKDNSSIIIRSGEFSPDEWSNNLTLNTRRILKLRRLTNNRK